MPQDRFSLLLSRTALWGCFLGATATLYFLGGVGGYLGSPPLNVVVAAGPILAGLFFLYVLFVSMAEKNRLGFVLWLLILLVFCAELVLGLVPPSARDELTHHLAIPRLYVRAGRIFEIPYAPYSYYPMLLDMLYGPWVRWGWDSIPKLIHGLFGFLTALLLYAYLSRRLNPIYGLLGFLFFISTPAILRLSTWAYVDLGVTFYSTASLLCVLRWLEEAKDKRWLALAGLSAGFALATKPNALLAFLLLFFLLALALAKDQERALGKTAFGLLLFFSWALLPFTPWLLKNMIQTGNPLFPLFAGLLGGPVEGNGDPGMGIFAKRELLYSENWWQIAALPLRLFFSGQDDKPQYFDGVLNPILILLLPWAFKGKWADEKRLLFAFAILYFLYALFLVDMRVRYILLVVPPLVILLVYGLHNVYLRIAYPSFLFGAVISLLALNGSYLWDYFHAVSPMDYLRGKESREAYLTRMLADYPAFGYINKNLPSTARVYLIFMGRRVYYCEREYFHDPGDNPWLLLRIIQSAQGQDDIPRGLREMGITHLLIRGRLLGKFLGNNLSSEELMKWNSFAAHHLRGLFHDRDYSLYQIYG